MAIQHLKRNIFVYAICTSLNIITSYSLLLFLTNNLPKAEYGLYGVITTVLNIIMIVVNFGHRDTFFKLASQRSYKKLSDILRAFLIWLMAFAVLSILFVSFNIVIAIAGFSFCCYLLLQASSSIQRGLGNYLIDAAAIPLYRLFWLAGLVIFWMVAGRLENELIFTISSIAALLALIVTGSFSLLRRLMLPVLNLTAPWRDSTLRNFFYLELATVSYMKLDILMLNFFDISNDRIAEYFLSIQIFEAVIFLVAPLSYMFFNKFNELRLSEKNEGLFTLITQVGILVITIALSVQLGWWLLGEWVVEVAFPLYKGSDQLTGILLIAVIPMGLSMVFSHLLFAVNKEQIYVKVCSISLLVCLILHVILIPNLGVEGAAVTRLIVEILIFVILLFVMKKYSKLIQN